MLPSLLRQDLLIPLLPLLSPVPLVSPPSQNSRPSILSLFLASLPSQNSRPSILSFFLACLPSQNSRPPVLSLSLDFLSCHVPVPATLPPPVHLQLPSLFPSPAFPVLRGRRVLLSVVRSNLGVGSLIALAARSHRRRKRKRRILTM